MYTDSGQPGDGDASSGAEEHDWSSSEGEAAAEAEELDAGGYSLHIRDTK